MAAAVGITRLGLFGAPRVNKTAPKIIIATGIGTALAVGVAVLFGSGAGSSVGLGTASAIGGGIASSAVGSAAGTSNVLARSRSKYVRLGLTATARPYPTTVFAGITAKSWSVTTVAALAGVVDPFNQFAINFSMQANVAANALAQPLIAGRSAGTSIVLGQAGFIASSAGSSTVTGLSTSLTNLFGVGIGISNGVGAANGVAPFSGTGSSAGVGAANGVMLGLGTIAVTATAAGSGAANGVGATVLPIFGTGTGQAVGVGWAYAVAPIDNTPPGAPGLIIASNITVSGVQLDWAATTDLGGSGLAGYLISRNGTLLTPIPVSDTTYVDAGLQSGQSYIYVITAVDNAGNPSLNNPSITVVTATSNASVSTVVIRRKDNTRI